MRGKKTSFMGVVLLVGAVAMLMGKLGYLKGIGFWSILLSSFLIVTLVRGILRMEFGKILFSVAFLIIVNDELLHLEAITPWTVLGAALLGTIGLKLMFPKIGRIVSMSEHPVQIEDKNVVKTCVQEGGSFSSENVFGEAVKSVTGEIGSVEIENVFGSTHIYFTEAVLREGCAHVDVDCAFGSVELYVPGDWTIDMNTQNAFGSSEHVGSCEPDGENILHVSGEVCFGSLRVISV